MDKIDVVVTWVNDTDPEWLAKKNEFQKEMEQDTSKSNYAVNRFRDWDLMRYWFRGIEKFMPWVNKVFFVTYGHLPQFLNTDHPKLRIVKHTDFIPAEYLPTFNSNTIELNLHRIKELSEQFILFNDDMYPCRRMKPELFFKNGLPCEEGVEGTLCVPGDGNSYYHILLNNVDVINRHFYKRKVIAGNWRKWYNWKYGIDNIRVLCLNPWKNFAGFKNAHLPVAILKSTMETVWKEETERLSNTSANRFRSVEDVNQYIFRYWQICTGNFEPRGSIGKRFEIMNDSTEKITKAIKNQKYDMICLNDPDNLETIENYQKEIEHAFGQILSCKSKFER